MSILPRTAPGGTPHRPLNTRTVFVTAPGGVVFTVAPEHADLCAERLARFIPHYAIGHVAAGNYFVVTEAYSETARWIVLITAGEMLRLWAPSYPAAVGRLSHHGRVVAAHGRGLAA